MSEMRQLVAYAIQIAVVEQTASLQEGQVQSRLS